MIIFIGNPDVDSIVEIILVLSQGNAAIRLSRRDILTYL